MEIDKYYLIAVLCFAVTLGCIIQAYYDVGFWDRILKDASQGMLIRSDGSTYQMINLSAKINLTNFSIIMDR